MNMALSANLVTAGAAHGFHRLLRVFPFIAIFLAGCATQQPPSNVAPNAQLTPATKITRDLLKLPEPKGKVVAAVYGFRDQTGQYKPSPDSSFSTSVTQGAASILVKALKDSGWFIPVERENLQDLLTERKIVRALETPQDKGNQVINLPQLTPATVLIEGGVIAYESNVRTGGGGAMYLGISLSTQYRVDQVTVSLRSVDIRTGQILNSVSTTKTIYSYEVNTGLNRFVGFKELLQAEMGYTRNEPAQLCVREAIEAAVVHLTVQGMKDRVWALKNERDWESPVIQSYLRENNAYLTEAEGDVAKVSENAITPAPQLLVPSVPSPTRTPVSAIEMRPTADAIALDTNYANPDLIY